MSSMSLKRYVVLVFVGMVIMGVVAGAVEVVTQLRTEGSPIDWDNVFIFSAAGSIWIFLISTYFWIGGRKNRKSSEDDQ